MIRSHVPDEDLLLLSHGALPPVRRLRTRAHLRGCPRCRRRREEFGRVSEAVATAIRAPSDAPWRPRSAPRVPRWVLLSVLASLALVLTWTLLVGLRHTRQALTPSRPFAGGCRPDLPNDRCR